MIERIMSSPSQPGLAWTTRCQKLLQTRSWATFNSRSVQDTYQSPTLLITTPCLLKPFAQRLRRTDALDDFLMADEIRAMEEALEAAPACDGPEKAAALNELAKAQWRAALSEHNGVLLRQAISSIQGAVSMSAEVPAKQAGYLNNLGIFTGDLASMERSTAMLEQSVDALERGSRCAPDSLKSTLLLNLANALRTQYGLGGGGDVNIINRAISTYQEGLAV